MKPKSALLVVDVQNALCTGDGATFEAKSIVTRINSVIQKARGSGTPILFVQHETKSGDFIVGSDGWQLADDLEKAASDIYIRKSCSDAFHNTDLQDHLDSLGIDHLFVCGIQSEFCVDSTIRRALALGYDVSIVADGHTTIDSEVLPASAIIKHHNHTWVNITSYEGSATAIFADDIKLPIT